VAAGKYKHLHPIREEKTMTCAQDVTNTTDVSSGEESAQNTEASNQSEKRCRLLCNPQRLPKPKAPRAEKRKMSEETQRIVKYYFHDQYAMKEKMARERKWI